MSDTRLILVTRQQRDRIEKLALHADKGDLDVREEEGVTLWAVSDAFDAACEPVTRRRCSTHDAEARNETSAHCWRAWHIDGIQRNGLCELVEEWCVPKPEATP